MSSIFSVGKKKRKRGKIAEMESEEKMGICNDGGEQHLGEKKQESWKNTKPQLQRQKESHYGDAHSLDHHKPGQPRSSNKALGTSGIQMDC